MRLPARVLLDAVAEAARLAGELALDHYRRGVGVELKGDGSPVTAADREAEQAVRDWISVRFPGDEVLGEEFGYTPGTGRRWFIDPIDGTKSFVRHVPLWGSMIGVAEGETVVAGAVYCPAVGEMVAAALGEGAWFNGVRCHVSDVSDIARATILHTDDRFAWNPERGVAWGALGARVAVARTWGDCYGYLQVATGRAELMVDDRLSPWDAAALIPIVQEAGGVYSDWKGGTRVDGGDGFASNAALAPTFRAALGIPEPSAS
ncbi:MAG: histidinol phosphate phosphatase [Gemmatimonadaceae bacterium]|nr:histidinol phosphate phosphatase [Gemmatimonadaceae bacterium]